MLKVYATGYSVRTLESWVKMVKKHEIEMLVDVRTLGKTQNKANKPEFSKESLAESLPQFGLKYYMIPKLGGYRHFSDHGFNKYTSPNKALSKDSGNGFTTEAHREYADYMYANPEFLEGVDELLDLAAQYKIAYFCCEGWYRKCHRNILSTYLTIFNLAKVYHITSGIRVQEHVNMDFAKVIDGKLVFPA